MKVKRYRTIYEAYNLNDELIARGLSEDVAMVVGVKKTTICGSALSGNRIYGKFLIKSLGRRYTEVEVDEKAREDVEGKIREEILENNLWNLKNHGNTVVTTDIDWHMEYFKEHGFDCVSRQIVHTNKKRRKERYYIVEVV